MIEPVRRRLDAAHAELGEALPDASKAAEVTRLLPGLLGGDRPRRYVVLFATPAESRELGGIVGNVVELTVDNGRVTITGHHRDDELNASGPGEFADRTDYPARFLLNHPELFAQNWAGMTDFPSVARAVAELYPTMGGRPVDGVLYTDPYGLAALMEFTGPIDVPELGRALDSESVAAFLLVEQYGAFALDDRLDFLEEIAVSTFARLLEVELPGPRRIGDVLGPAARQGRLRMATFDDEENALLDRLFLLGAQPSNDGSDYLAVVHANGGADKLDAFLTRRVQYNAVVDPATGGTTAKVTVSLSNEVEPDGLPSYVIGSPTRGIPPGTNRVHLSIVTPHQLEAVNVDGVRVDAEPQVEFGFSRYLVFVDVAPGSSSEVTFDLSGVVALNVGEYHLRVGQQAVANPDQIAIEVTLGDQRLTEQFLLLEDTRFTLSSTPR